MKKAILFVCHGNICRSPIAEGVVGALADAKNLSLTLDSAGTSGWHEGEAPDERAQAICQSKGIDISRQKSRSVCKEDFTAFDLILAMDRSNLDGLNAVKPKNASAEVKLFLDYAAALPHQEVPDPYYNSNGFSEVLQMVEAAAAGLLADLKA